MLRRLLFFFVMVGSLLATGGCAEALVGDASSDDPRSVFDAYWTEFDRYYAHFGLKGVDWDSVRTAYEPRVTASTTDRELFDVLAAMTATLRDGHTGLRTPVGNYAYSVAPSDSLDNFDRARLELTVQNLRRGSPVVERGRLPDAIGYVRVSSFGASAEAYDTISEIVREVEAIRFNQGIVIDVRNNSGGSDANVRAVAAPFIREEAVFGYARRRNGPNRDDLTDFIPRTTAPSTSDPYGELVAVVTNGGCASACETFVLTMRSQLNVAIVGTTTAGSAGAPTVRDLPNGWRVRLPRWTFYDSNREPVEDRGIDPDVPATLDPDTGQDTLLRRAVTAINAAGGRY